MTPNETAQETVDVKRLQEIEGLLGGEQELISLNDRGREKRGRARQTVTLEKETRILYTPSTGQYSLKIPKRVAALSNIDSEKNKMLFYITIKTDKDGNVVRKLTAELV